MKYKLHILLFLFILLSVTESRAQFIRGVGVFGSVTTSRHAYVNKSDTAYVPSHRGAEYISWGAGAVVEMLPFEIIRWRSEVEYINKGSVENEYRWNTDERNRKVNKYTYLAWNNFAMLRIFEGDYLLTYALAGFRTEYNLSKITPAYMAYSSAFRKINLSPDVAMGFELVTLGKVRFFSEIHYNPDVFNENTNHRTTKVGIKNRTWELRVGIMLRPKRMLDIDCNAPRYIEP